MKMASALGSWLRRRLDGRWQWIALIGILAVFNTAQDEWDYAEMFACYSFRIEPDFVLMDVREKSRKLQVMAWEGTLTISHNCKSEVVLVASNNSTGSISVSADPSGLSFTGKCLITATDTRSNGKVYMATASIEVAKLPIHVYIEESANVSNDFGTAQRLSVGQSMSISVTGGVRPFKWVRNLFPGVLDIQPPNPTSGAFTVKALKDGIGGVQIKDGGEPPDLILLTFKVGQDTR